LKEGLAVKRSQRSCAPAVFSENFRDLVRASPSRLTEAFFVSLIVGDIGDSDKHEEVSDGAEGSKPRESSVLPGWKRLGALRAGWEP
jgi:hypothetical protein